MRNFAIVAGGILASALGAAAVANVLPVDDFHDALVGKHMRALHEQPLQNAARDPTAEIYRMITLPSFNHPVSVRVTVPTTGAAAATVRLTTGKGGYGAGKLAAEHAVSVAPEDVATLRATLDAAFDRLPTDEIEAQKAVSDQEPVICTDGTLLVIERVRAGRYHAVLRHCFIEGALGPAIKIFNRIAHPYLPPGADDEEYGPPPAG
jgi:hypothetical protein